MMMNALLALLIMMRLDPSTAYAALAVAACESGDTITYGSYDSDARSATSDGGAFQFNDATWYWMTNQEDFTADQAPLYYQILMFDRLWAHGQGSDHWSASRACWTQWLSADGTPLYTSHYGMYLQVLQLYQ